MILYHFTTSPFSRRVRLVLALKGLHAELRDARGAPPHREELSRLNPLHTVPVLVDEERVIPDSNAIIHYLDRKYPEPPVWAPGLAGADAFELGALADSAISILIDLGMRYSELHGDAKFPVVRRHMVGRAQRALEVLAQKVTQKGLASGPLCGGTWGAADIGLFTTVTWLEGIPVRAAIFEPARALLALGWSLPAALSEWANQHRARPDVLALG